MASKLLLRLVTHPVVVKVGHPSIEMSASDKVERPNTLVVTVPEELSSESHAVIADKLISSLGDAVCSIQFVKHFVRVTFSSFDARNRAFLSGIFIDSIRLVAVEADPVLKDVYLEYLPFEVPDDVVREALGRFGAVNEIVHLKHAGTPVYNGTRLLKMSLASDVPVNVRILRYPCRVFYNGQPRPCSICRSSDHRAFDCPLRDVCRRCRKPGHFARDCPEVPAPSVWGNVSVPAPPAQGGDDVQSDDVADDDDADDVDFVDDDVSSGDDDDDDVDEEFASGDDEVLQSAPVPSVRPTRSSNVPASPPVSASPPVPPPAASSAPVPASPPVPPPVSSPTPMDTSDLVYADRPQWIKRAPEWILERLSKRPHSSDTHISVEEYSSGSVSVAFDFGRLTFRFLKETRFPEEDRFYAYLTGAVSHPSPSAFAAPAKCLPPLSADVVPARFPVLR